MFNEFPDYSKVWIFQSETFFDKTTIDKINSYWDSFKQNWNAHGNLLKSELKVTNDLFITICLDETNSKATGCAIDKLTQFIIELEQKLNISLLNRSIVAYYNDNKLQLTELNELKNLFQRNTINDNTKIHNNLVNTLKQLNEEWIIPINKSWHKNFI